MPSENESGEFQAPDALFTCEDYLLGEFPSIDEFLY